MLVFCWILGVWLMGWVALPVTRRVFVALPDGGLAVARVLFVALGSLLVFWLATLHLAPLRLVPLIFGTLGLVSVAVLFAPEEQREFLVFAQTRRKALLASDASSAFRRVCAKTRNSRCWHRMRCFWRPLFFSFTCAGATQR